MIADCETCHRKQVPCMSCDESQRAICFICQGDTFDPYCELNEAICLTLYELQADVDYLFGRVAADGSCAPVMAASVKSKLGALEIALESAHYAGNETSDDYPTEYIARLRTYVDEDGQLSHRNGLTLLNEVERLQGLVPRYLGGTRT